ncbi:MAG: hypothetical protein ACKVRP_11510 [Bacteroidota bacterium]
MKLTTIFAVGLFSIILLMGCSEQDSPLASGPSPRDPNTASKVSIDRFSATSGTLFVRDGSNGLPATNQAINFDIAPFITDGFGPNGEIVKYYNFDVQPTDPAPLYVLFRSGESSPVPSQLNIVDVIPGDGTYNDFWQIVKVTVPSTYVANIVASHAEIVAAGYQTETTTMIVNCPIAPEGSTAIRRVGGGGTAMVRGWYRGQIVFYFTFEESLLAASGDMVPVSPIYVTFNVNPGQPGGGPPSGFMVEPGTAMTHNVLATMPGQGGYSPLWSVNIYDNSQFVSVQNLATAQSATHLVVGAATVNCPMASIP